MMIIDILTNPKDLAYIAVIALAVVCLAKSLKQFNKKIADKRQKKAEEAETHA